MFLLPVEADTQLRLMAEADAEALLALIDANRADLSRWLPWVDETRTLEDARRFIRFGLRQYMNHNGMQAGVWVGGQLAGDAGYNYIDHARRQTEIGYWLGQAFRGRGIMTKVCRILTTYAFDTLGLDSVKIRCAVDNDRSRAIPERLGYEVEGLAPQLDWATDHYIDTIMYSMAAADWPLTARTHEAS